MTTTPSSRRTRVATSRSPRVEASHRTRVAVIGGGQNSEHEVGLATAASVAASLDPRTYDAVRLTIGRDGHWSDAAGHAFPGGLADAVAVISGCDVVFPAVHGPRGEDGALAALCELAGVPYVGSGIGAGALAMDKWATKLVAEALGIRTARAVLVTAPTDTVALPMPVVVKPVAAGSSHGVTRVADPALLAGAVEEALLHDSRVLVEEFVAGREIDVAVLGTADGDRRVGPPLEIVVEAGALFDTDSKYDGTADFRLPAQVSEDEHRRLTSASLALFDALGCAGVARFDFFLTPAGLVLNEVNTMPGMTGQSQVPRMFASTGLAYPDLLDALVTAALRGPR
ncbi:D-alanine--D-alanine ligase [Streptomyces sp. NPDC051569]|uniref:D-alanine--D-alanine ligase n=1 Tax=Streptomyces sp. NPDC051569 TaxID=3365661 RepID=UPI0037BB935B